MQESMPSKRSRTPQRITLLRFYSVFLIIAFLLFPAGSVVHAGLGNPDPPGQFVQIQLLAFNDYHGYLESGGNPGPGTIGNDPAGGGEFLSTRLSQLRQGKKYSLTVAAGDLIGGSPF